MAFVLAVEAWQAVGNVLNSAWDRVRRRMGREGGEMSAGCGAGFVGAVWTIAVVVVDAVERDI
jgi:hypothetical protein